MVTDGKLSVSAFERFQSQTTPSLYPGRVRVKIKLNQCVNDARDNGRLTGTQDWHATGMYAVLK